MANQRQLHNLQILSVKIYLSKEIKETSFYRLQVYICLRCKKAVSLKDEVEPDRKSVQELRVALFSHPERLAIWIMSRFDVRKKRSHTELRLYLDGGREKEIMCNALVFWIRYVESDWYESNPKNQRDITARVIEALVAELKLNREDFNLLRKAWQDKALLKVKGSKFTLRHQLESSEYNPKWTQRLPLELQGLWKAIPIKSEARVEASATAPPVAPSHNTGTPREVDEAADSANADIITPTTA